MNVTDLFVSEMLAFSKQEFPEHIVHRVERCVLDYIGVTYAGAAKTKEKTEVYLKACSAQGECSLVGLNQKADMHTAAFINGFTSHVIELDDGHRFGMLHLEAPVISAMLAVAQKEKLSVEQFIKGVVTGYEATTRLAIAVQPVHKQRGFHATGTCGTIGVACAVAAALNFNADEMKNAVSAAATSASGLLEVIDDASQLKPYNVAAAVSGGISAAYFGKAGFNGPNDVLGGKRGFFSALNGEFKAEALNGDKDGLYAIEKIYVKPYAACRHCHSAIECALKLSSAYSLDPEKIKSISVETYKLAVFGHDHVNIAGVSSAKMSTPYGVAAAVILHDAGVDAFHEDEVKREDILELCKKVSVIENPELTAVSPGKRGAIVSVTMQDGAVYREQVEYPLGEPENNISDDGLAAKYKSLMRIGGASADEIDGIADMIWNLKDNFEGFLLKI